MEHQELLSVPQVWRLPLLHHPPPTDVVTRLQSVVLCGDGWKWVRATDIQPCLQVAKIATSVRVVNHLTVKIRYLKISNNRAAHPAHRWAHSADGGLHFHSLPTRRCQGFSGWSIKQRMYRPAHLAVYFMQPAMASVSHHPPHRVFSRAVLPHCP